MSLFAKESKWVLPKVKEGRVDIARLDIMDRATNEGEASEWFTYKDLLSRNFNMIILHIFILLTEPLVYLRYTVMESSGRNPVWFTVLVAIFLPIKPLFTIVLTAI